MLGLVVFLGCSLGYGVALPNSLLRYPWCSFLVLAGVEGDVSLIYGEAKGKLAAGYWKGEDGKWHRELGVQLKGELDLFKAEAKGHVTVAGVKAEGSAAVKFGIGAELNAGFVDGKFNFKLGVAAGLGFELGFSLDFGSLGSTVKSGAKKLWSGVKSLFSGSSKDASVYGGS